MTRFFDVQRRPRPPGTLTPALARLLAKVEAFLVDEGCMAAPLSRQACALRVTRAGRGMTIEVVDVAAYPPSSPLPRHHYLVRSIAEARAAALSAELFSDTVSP